MIGNEPNLVVLAGDGIGPEVTAEAVRVLDWVREHRRFACRVSHQDYGVDCYKKTGEILTEKTFADIMKADAVLFGATGGSAFDEIPVEVRRRGSLLRIRKDMQVFANLRPVKAFDELADASTLRPEVTKGVDMIILRELNGGLYFGEPRGIETLPDGNRRGVNTQVYTTPEIVRIGRVAFELARTRRGRVCSVEKSNVMESGLLWRQEMQKLRDAEYRDVELSHMYADNCAMQLVRNPRQFDVIVTDNMFGDVLSDCAAMITGSLGMLPSASLGAADPTGRRASLYEPIHGSAPDIAGKGIANPLGAILSVGMALRHSFGRAEDADLLERAVKSALVKGARTADIAAAGKKPVKTVEMGDAVLRELDALAR